MTFDDYKVSDGINWPHTFTTMIAGKKVEELRLQAFRINPKIDPKVFAPRAPLPPK